MKRFHVHVGVEDLAKSIAFYNGLFGAAGPGQTVRTMPIFMYVIMAIIGVMFSLIGSYVGERIQLGAPPKSEA